MLQAYLLTILAPLLGGVFLVSKNKKDDKAFFGKDYTNALKGLCCLIVIYVHVGNGHGNALQEAIGSFAYVAVTLFFLFSAYGMILSVERKETYLRDFWRNRLAALLIPCILINVVSFGLGIVKSGEYHLSALYQLNGYVTVLLQWCVWFYIVEWCRVKWFAERKILTDWILVAGVVVSSLCLYFFVDAEVSAEAGWCFERVGLVWGVLLYRYFGKIKEWMGTHYWAKVVILTLLGGILGVAYLKYKVVFFWGAYLLKIVLGLVLIALLLTATSGRQWGNKVSQWLGDVSYEVYLSHGMVMGALEYWLPEGIDSGIFILLTVCVTLALSTGVHAAVKPFVKVLRK